MDTTKIRLSPEEVALIKRSDWILTKNSIIKKVNQLLGGIQSAQQSLLKPYYPLLQEEIIQSSPKISRGENYKGLPWLVLDYPRFFNKEDFFVIRTLFWWGNFFSCTLHTSGRYKKMYEKKIIDSFGSMKNEDFFICINDDQWEHHFDIGNYSPLQELTASRFNEIIDNRNFVKLAKKFPLEQWDTAEKKLLEIFGQLIHALMA